MIYNYDNSLQYCVQECNDGYMVTLEFINMFEGSGALYCCTINELPKSKEHLELILAYMD